MYEIALFLHVLAGLLWVGAGIFLQLQMVRVRSAQGQAVVADQGDDFAWTDKLIFMPASLVAILTGVFMVIDNDAWEFSQVWVIVALALWVLSAIMGGAVGGRTIKQIESVRSEGGDVGPLVDRYLATTWIDVLILLGLVAMMVFKPGT